MTFACEFGVIDFVASAFVNSDGHIAGAGNFYQFVGRAVEGLDWHIKESVPDNIKRIAEEWRKLVDEEFRQAKEMIF